MMRFVVEIECCAERFHRNAEKFLKLKGMLKLTTEFWGFLDVCHF